MIYCILWMNRCNMRKRKISAAIVYEQGEPAPVLLAKGKGCKAERIIEIARQEGIAIVEDAALAALLDSSVNPGDFIPPWCWEAAAKILAFVMENDDLEKNEKISY